MATDCLVVLYALVYKVYKVCKSRERRMNSLSLEQHYTLSNGKHHHHNNNSNIICNELLIIQNVIWYVGGMV